MYTENWYLPGSGVRKGESLVKALGRELWEETGIQRYESLQLLGTYANFYESKSDYISVFILFNPNPITGTDDAEIAAIQYFPLNQLPDNLSPGTRKRIAEYLGEKPIDFNW